jgi:hypothetical protein
MAVGHPKDGVVPAKKRVGKVSRASRSVTIRLTCDMNTERGCLLSALEPPEEPASVNQFDIRSCPLKPESRGLSYLKLVEQHPKSPEESRRKPRGREFLQPELFARPRKQERGDDHDLDVLGEEGFERGPYHFTVRVGSRLMVHVRGDGQGSSHGGEGDGQG